MTIELSGCQRLPKLAGKFASCAFFSVKIFLHLETGRRKLKKKRERENNSGTKKEFVFGYQAEGGTNLQPAET